MASPHCCDHVTASTLTALALTAPALTALSLTALALPAPPPSPPPSPPPPSPPPAVPQLCPACRAFVNALKTDNGLRGARRVVRCDEIHIGFIGFSTASTYRLSSRIHIGFMSGSYLVHVG